MNSAVVVLVVVVDVANMYTSVVAGFDVAIAVSEKPTGPDSWLVIRGILW